MNARHGAARRAAPLTLLMALLTASLLSALATAGPAWAHAARIGTDPAENASLPAAPARVDATFNEPMQPEFAAMTVVGADGSQWADGRPSVDGAVVGIAVKPGAPAGPYTVNYRATSADGHVVTGSWSFRVTGPAAPASPAATSAPVAAPQSAPADDGIPVWPFAVAAVVLIAGGALWAVRRRS
jgi:copper resistance protein C